MEQLTEILKSATAAVGKEHFFVNVDRGGAIFRERVYCYELYHQMRLLWADGRYVLNGELDKSGHPTLKDLGLNRRKPDFLVHSPGSMQHNHAIIEVKGAKLRRYGIEKDLDTLHRFRTDGKYGRAIYLIFGNKKTEAIQRIIGRYVKKDYKIELWHHHAPGLPAEKVCTLGEQ